MKRTLKNKIVLKMLMLAMISLGISAHADRGHERRGPVGVAMIAVYYGKDCTGLARTLIPVGLRGIDCNQFSNSSYYSNARMKVAGTRDCSHAPEYYTEREICKKYNPQHK